MSRLRCTSRRSAEQRLLGRAVFVGSLLVFLIIGIGMVGDFSAQWWLLPLPVVLLIGPALAVRREAARRRGGDQETTPLGEGIG